MGRPKFACYLAGNMENVSTTDMIDWRDEITKKLAHPELLIYDPVAVETKKVHRCPEEQIEYIAGLKRGGHWAKFYDEMWRIWNSTISKNTDILQVLQHLRMRKHIEGNTEALFHNHVGDAEAVIRSDFIIARIIKDIKTVGSIVEITLAALFKIPIYLILPDQNISDTNSTLLFLAQYSGGKTFTKMDECVKAVKEGYKL